MASVREPFSGWLLLLVLGVWLAPRPAAATDYHWNLPLDGFFSDPANWTPSAVPPGANDRAIFAVSGTYTVSFVTSPTNVALSARFGDVTLDVRTTQVYTLTNTSGPSFVVGDKSGENGALTLVNTSLPCIPVPCPGSIDAQGASIGNDPGSIGAATVGSGLVVTLTDLWVGLGGSGSFTVSGGSVQAVVETFVGHQTGSTGVMMVDGGMLESPILRVGQAGDGTLSIAGGGVSNDSAWVGAAAGSQGTLFVTGAGSTWAVDSIVYVGESGTGEMTISDGGSVTDARGRLGVLPGSNGTVTVAGTGSTWVNDSPAYLAESTLIGESGTGELTISAGGYVGTGTTVLGFEPGGSGSATVTGAGSIWNHVSPARLVVGNKGAGTVTVSAAASVDADSSEIAWQAGSSGSATVTGAGSQWTGVSLSVGGGTTAAGGAGTLDVDAGASVDMTDRVRIWTGSTATLNGGTINASQVDVNGGSLLGTGVVNATIVNNGGTVSPGLSPGVLTLNADYVQDDTGNLTVEIGGVIAGTDYDVVDVQGSCTLAGRLDVTLTGGFAPSLGDAFDVLSCTSLTGGFTALDGLVLGAGLVLQPRYSSTGLTLRVVPKPEPVPALSGGALSILTGVLVASARRTLGRRAAHLP